MAVEVRDVGDALIGVVTDYLQPPEIPHQPIQVAPLGLADEAVLRIIKKSKQAPKFDALWNGDTSAYASDDSAADMALCSILAFYCDAPQQVDRIFRSSLLMREKWDSRRGAITYGAITVERAWESQSDHYKLQGDSAKRMSHRSGSSSNGRRPQPETTIPMDRDFWEARPELRLVYAFGLSRRASPPPLHPLSCFPR